MISRRLGDFVLRDRLGEGGHGEVYVAEQPALQREAVVKIARVAGDPARFLAEARLASRLEHPYAAHTYAFGAEDDGVVWIAMELVRGTPLDELLAVRGPLALDRFVPLFDKICEVVHTAHEQGIVHRDLKPANIMVMARAGQLLPKLLDFGIAAAADGGGPGGAGTPAYMAPEQWRDPAAADARTDIYALGIVAYELLTGERPFAGDSLRALAKAHARQPPPALESPVAAPIARALAKAPADRFATALELAAAVRAASGLDRAAVAVPRLPAAVRDRALARAPQPIAELVAAFEGARNPHQARDAALAIARGTTRLLTAISLAARAHVKPERLDPEHIRALLRGELDDTGWLSLLRDACAPFARQPELHPLPELIECLYTRDGDPDGALGVALDALHAVARAPAADEATAVALVTEAIDDLVILLDAIDLLSTYELCIVRPDGTEHWTGLRRPRAAFPPPEGGRGRVGGEEAALLDAQSNIATTLHPLVQPAPPSPGAPDELFILDDRADLRAFPAGFQHHDPAVATYLRDHFLDGDADSVHEQARERQPYPGLAAFTAADADVFFGRERETEAALNRLRVQPLLAVVGPSGAGKSSFVHAGVVPNLPPGWTATAIRPGAAPLAALRAAPDATVLVVDQFEELFTLGAPPDEQTAFAAELAARARTHDRRVVLTLRDDFLIRAQQLAPLRDRLAQGLLLLATPGVDDLERVVIEPARRAGYDFDDPALPRRMVREVEGQPGALALLAFTAAQLWDHRDRALHRLPAKAYDQLGGVGGALSNHADAVVDALTADERTAARAIFRALVTADGTRAVVPRAALLDIAGPRAEPVIEKLVAARLVVMSESDDVEVIHEALLATWPRLIGWMREDRDALRLRDQLRAAAKQWDDRARPEGLLWRGDALAELELWRRRTPDPLPDLERTFADASRSAARRGRRLRAALVATAFLFLLAGVAALYIQNTRTERARAESQRRLAEQYEESARQAYIDGDPMRAAVYLVAAEEAGASGRVPQRLLRRLITAALPERPVIGAHRAAVGIVRVAPDGTRALSCGFDGSVMLWRLGAVDERFALSEHRSRVSACAFDHSGMRAITGDADGRIAIWDGVSGQLIASWTAHAGGVHSMAWSDDDAFVVTGARDGESIVWRAATGELAATHLGQTGLVNVVALAPDGERALTGTADGSAHIWDLRTARTLVTLPHDASVRGGAFVAGGKLVVTGDGAGQLMLWDAATGKLLHRVAAHTASINSLVVSPDGRSVLTGGQDNVARTWVVDGLGLQVAFFGHDGAVTRAAFCGEDRIVTASNDGTVKWWTSDRGIELATLVGHRERVYYVECAADGRSAISASGNGDVRRWQLDHSLYHGELESPFPVMQMAPSRDGAMLAGFGPEGVVIWEVGSGRELARHRFDSLSMAQFAGDDTLLVTDGNRVTEIEVRTGHRRVIAHLSGAAFGVSALPGGTRVVAFLTTGGATVVDRESGREVFRLEGEDLFVLAAEPSPDGLWLAGGCSDGVVRVWRASDGALVGELRAHRAEVFDVEFSTDGAQLVTGGGDGTIIVWDWQRREPSLTLLGHTRAVASVRLSAADTLVVSASIDGTARVWQADSGQPLWIVKNGARPTDAVLAPDANELFVAGGGVDRWSLATRPPRVDLDSWVRCRAPFALERGKIVGRPLQRVCD